MRALAWRQLLAATRVPAVWAASGLHVTALTAYVYVWGNGIPLAGARSPFEQFATAQTVVLLLVLPWIVARGATIHDRRFVARLAVLSARPPATVMTAAAAALAALALAVALTGLPLAILSQQISDGPAADLAAGQLWVAALGVCAGTITLATVSFSRSRVVGWLLGTSVTALVAWLAPRGPAGALVPAVTAAVATAAMARHAQRLWNYRAEYPA